MATPSVVGSPKMGQREPATSISVFSGSPGDFAVGAFSKKNDHIINFTSTYGNTGELQTAMNPLLLSKNVSFYCIAFSKDAKQDGYQCIHISKIQDVGVEACRKVTVQFGETVTVTQQTKHQYDNKLEGTRLFATKGSLAKGTCPSMVNINSEYLGAFVLQSVAPTPASVKEKEEDKEDDFPTYV